MTQGQAIATISTDFYHLAPLTVVLSYVLSILAYFGALWGLATSIRKSKLRATTNPNIHTVLSESLNTMTSRSSLKIELLSLTVYFLPILGVFLLGHFVCLDRGGSVVNLINNQGGLPIITWIPMIVLTSAGVDEPFIYVLGQFFSPGSNYVHSLGVGVNLLWSFIAVASSFVSVYAFKFLTLWIYDSLFGFFDKVWSKVERSASTLEFPFS